MVSLPSVEEAIVIEVWISVCNSSDSRVSV